MPTVNQMLSPLQNRIMSAAARGRLIDSENQDLRQDFPMCSTLVDSLEDGNADDEAEGLVKFRTFVCASGCEEGKRSKEGISGTSSQRRKKRKKLCSPDQRDGWRMEAIAQWNEDGAYECGDVGFRAEQPGDMDLDFARTGGRARQGRLPRKWSKKRIIQSHQYKDIPMCSTPVKFSTVLTLENGNMDKGIAGEVQTFECASWW
ncbi:hypothetical protein C8R45DRAFT_1078333 [Mycena sanguinolenta]|nr:hypothetical protein C8R45DRAFT_1078333 [Mycena sanguinolenta]